MQLDPQPRWSVLAASLIVQRLSTAARSPPAARAAAARLFAPRTPQGRRGVLNWELLAQTAQALRLPDLLALGQSCPPQTVRQIEWANAYLEASSPQTIAS